MKPYCRIIAILIYRVMEKLDGEKGLKLIDYDTAEKIKIKALEFIN